MAPNFLQMSSYLKTRKQSMIEKINRVLFFLLSFCLCLSGYELKAQLRYKVLFLGNSYTSVNNLPQMIQDIALSAGDTLVFDSYAPGGYQLADHSQDAVSQSKIMSGGWDYVVIQGQSQEPITLPGQFNGGAGALYNLVKQYNPCAVTMPYMTWGRKNGDAPNCAAFPVMCTYQGMDTTLRNCYKSLTNGINGEVAPVSVVWNDLRQNHPGIELYQADESHPSVAGTYAAACCFYTALFKKDPALITFNAGLSASDASIIKNAVKTKVFDNLHLWDFKKMPVSGFSYQVGTGMNEVILNPVNLGVRQTYLWDFGDGTTSSVPNLTHSYVANGTYTISLTTTNCDLQGLHTSFTDTTIQFCSHTPTIYTTNPWLCTYDTLRTQAADAYQWFAQGVPIPETNQFLPDYARYAVSGFTVRTTVNGCAELSTVYTGSVEWSGYYFDALGDPCAGDTVAFAVLHINGFLSGSENIQWFKNGTLLPWMTNKDTLLITTSGAYECKVINPGSTCPFDTTAYLVEYDCGTTAIRQRDPEVWGTISPNPASEMITLTLSKHAMGAPIRIYNAIGSLVRSVAPTGTTMNIPIADLPKGLYYIRLKSREQPALKFIRL